MTLRLNGDSSGFTEIKAADAAGDNSIKLPAANGGANQLLQNGGTAGELQYTSAGGGLHYDSSGRLLLGSSNASKNANRLPGTAFGLVGVGANYPSHVITGYGTANADAGPVFDMQKSRGESDGSMTAVIDNDRLGSIQFLGSDGTNFVRGGGITGRVDGNPSLGVMPSEMVFSTNSGGATPTDRIAITSTGALKLLSGCPGIDFSAIQTNATGMTSETLDSYEEGTWTPEYVTSFINYSYGQQDGTYVKIGSIVLARYHLKVNNVISAGSGIVTINLPFAARNETSNGWTGSVGWHGNLTGWSSVPYNFAVIRGTSTAFLHDVNPTTGEIGDMAASSVGNNALVEGMIIYQV